jgi:hypothetical protein
MNALKATMKRQIRSRGHVGCCLAHRLQIRMSVKNRSDLDSNIFLLCHLKETYSNQPHTCYHWPVKPVSLNGVQNLCEHQHLLALLCHFGSQ